MATATFGANSYGTPSFGATSALRQEAEQWKGLTQKLAWAAVVLFLALTVSLTYTLTSTIRYSGLCNVIAEQAVSKYSKKTGEFAQGLQSGYCQ